MSIFDQVRDQVNSADWRFRPYDGFVVRPLNTFKEIVNSTFSPVQDAWRTARHCSLYEMYHPQLGEYRQRKNYSSLAPSNAMPYSDRALAPRLSCHHSYQPKKDEWLTEMKKPQRYLKATRSLPAINLLSEEKETFVKKKRREIFTVPLTTTRAENYYLYWTGRFNGVVSCGPLFYPSNFEGLEDRRYHRIFWGPNLINYVTPTARHAASLLLSAY